MLVALRRTGVSMLSKRAGARVVLTLLSAAALIAGCAQPAPPPSALPAATKCRQLTLRSSQEVAIVQALQSQAFVAEFGLAEPLQVINIRLPRLNASVSRSMKAGDKYTVRAQFDVSAQGSTENVEIIESSNTHLSNLTRDAIASWCFAPPRFVDQPRRVRLHQTVEFVLVE